VTADAPGIGRRAVLRAACLLAVGGCAAFEPRAAYRLATAEPAGFFNEFGTLLARVVGESDLPLTLTPLLSSGSVENFDLLRTGRAELCLALADSALDVRPDALALGRLYENYMQVAVPARSDVRRVADLRGRRISLGLSTGTVFAARRVLEAAGVTGSEVVVDPVAVLDILAALTDGRIEAAFFLGGVPHPPVDPAGKRGPEGGIRLLDLDAEIPVLRERHGRVYQPTELRPGLYGANGPVRTVGIPSLLMARPDLREDHVAALVDVLRSRADALVPAGALGAQYLDARSLVHTFGVPLHPGAVRAYREGHG
jgi:TRAP transporter TAXI family solute receptor